MEKTIYAKLPKVFKQKWIEALRSKEYKQATGSLVDEIDTNKKGEPILGYCCLGVAGKICGIPDSKMEGHGELNKHLGKRVPNTLVMGYQSKGVSPVTHLISLNDDEGWSFRKIATCIEKNL